MMCNFIDMNVRACFSALCAFEALVSSVVVLVVLCHQKNHLNFSFVQTPFD